MQCHRSLRSRPARAVLGALLWLAVAHLVSGPSGAGDPELRPSHRPSVKPAAPVKKPVGRRKPRPRPPPVEEPAEEQEEAPAPAAVPPPAPAPTPSASPAGRLGTLLERRQELAVARAAQRAPQPADLLGHWQWAVGGGKRTGLVHLTSIRADGRAVGTFTSEGMAGRCEAGIGNGKVEFIMRWSVLFVHGRVHGTAPVEHLQRNPVLLEGTWDGTNLEGLTWDFVVRRAGS